MRLWPLIAFIALTAAAAPLRAQQLPSQGQVQQLLQNPDVVAQLQQRIEQSGMTPDQIRARVEALGYPSSILDAYLPGGGATSDSVPSASVLDAISQLGLIERGGVDGLQGAAPLDTIIMRRPRGPRDTVPSEPDTLMLRDDSVAMAAAAAAARRRAMPPGSADQSQNRIDQYQRGLDTSALLRAGAVSGTTVGGVGGLRGIDTAALLAQQRRLRTLRAPPDTGLPIFGLNLFRRGTSQFQPNVGGPVDANYRLGPGDRLVLVLTGEVEQARPLTVTREGFIVIPQVGQIYVANLTLGQLDDLLYDRLGRVYSSIRRGPNAKTHFSVSVARLRSNQIFVVGDVTIPGSYEVSSAGTVLTALYAAMGPTVNGSLRRIEVRRAGKLVDSLDVYDYLLRGDASHDARLETGDVVFVPVHGARIEVTGEVVRPAVYELKSGETLRDALQAAGGFTPLASRRRVQITRILKPTARSDSAGGHDRVVIDVASSELATGFGPPIPIEAGDSIAVFEIADRLRNRIAVRGDVWSPGTQGFTSGERLSDAIKLAGGVRPDAFLGEVLVTRLESDSVRTQLRTALRDSTGVPVDDILLHDDDAIQIFALREFRPRRYVAIAGAVKKSGRYSYRDGMTMRDLVLLAGGMQDGAYLQEAEIARLPENRAGGVTATTVRVPLDSTYLFARGPDGKYLGPPGVPAPSGHAADVPLRPYDNVLILRQPSWDLQRSISLTGEIKYPGRYTLVNKSERLRDVIARAGGLTNEAYADGIALYRTKESVGRIGVDLPRVLRRAKDRDNLILQDGDSINIPIYTGLVRVGGAVNAPTAIPYVPGENLNYYIRAAGGPGNKADPGRAYVTQPDGKIESVSHVLFFRDVPDPRPGSFVFVPEQDVTQHGNDIAAYGLIAQIIGSLVTIVVIARR